MIILIKQILCPSLEALETNDEFIVASNIDIIKYIKKKIHFWGSLLTSPSVVSQT